LERRQQPYSDGHRSTKRTEEANFTGNTPVVALDGLFEQFELIAKLEGWNPSGSAKDRAATNILMQARKAGRLTADSSLLVSSSGNMAISVARAGACLGLPVRCVVDELTTPMNIRLLEVYGATYEVISRKDAGGLSLLAARLKRVEQLTAEPGVFCVDQYVNPDGPASYWSLIREVVAQVPNVTHVICPMSTCAMLRGCRDFIADSGAAISLIGVDAVGSFITDTTSGFRSIPGLGAGIRPPFYYEGLADSVVRVSAREVVTACRLVLARTGLLVGGSSGAAVSALSRIQRTIRPGSVCVAIFPDRGERYVDTIYNESWVRRWVDAPTND